MPSVREDFCRAQREPPNNGKTAYPIYDRLPIIVHQWQDIRNARNIGPAREQRANRFFLPEYHRLPRTVGRLHRSRARECDLFGKRVFGTRFGVKTQNCLCKNKCISCALVFCDAFCLRCIPENVTPGWRTTLAVDGTCRHARPKGK